MSQSSTSNQVTERYKSLSLWEVYAPEGEFHGKHGHPHSYSICIDTADHRHECIALVFGKTDKEAAQNAETIVIAARRLEKSIRP